MDSAPRTQVPKTIDVTLDGDVLAPPSLWRKLARLWHVLPRGSVPAVAVTVVVVAALAVVLLGVLLVAVPLLLVAAIVSALVRNRRLTAR